MFSDGQSESEHRHPQERLPQHGGVEGAASLPAGGDGGAAKAGLGLVPHGQPHKRKLQQCESAAHGLTGKAGQQQQQQQHPAQQLSAVVVSTADKKRVRRSRRKTKWNVEPGLSVVRKAIYLFRNGVGNSVQIERLLQVPARTLRRYVGESLDPSNALFYVPETPHERRGRELQEAGERHGIYSRKSFEAAVLYAHPRHTRLADEVVAAAAEFSGGGGGDDDDGSTTMVPLELGGTTATTAAAAAQVVVAAPAQQQLCWQTSLGGGEASMDAAAAAVSSSGPASLDFSVMDFLGDLGDGTAVLDDWLAHTPGGALLSGGLLCPPHSRALSLNEFYDEVVQLPVSPLGGDIGGGGNSSDDDDDAAAESDVAAATSAPKTIAEHEAASLLMPQHQRYIECATQRQLVQQASW